MPFEIAKAKIEPGQYRGQLTRVERGQGKFGAQCEWFFAVEIPGADELQEHKEFTSANTGPGSKAYSFLKGLIGRELQSGEVVDDPVGTTALLTFEQKPNGYTGITAITPIVSPVQEEVGIPR